MSKTNTIIYTRIISKQTVSSIIIFYRDFQKNTKNVTLIGIKWTFQSGRVIKIVFKELMK